MVIHVVKQGETLYGIAEYYNVNPERVSEDNGIYNVESLVVGQALAIRFPRVLHTVTEGESLYQIGLSYNKTELELMQNNPLLVNRDTLYTGESIIIEYEDEPSIIKRFNGYAYQYINIRILRTALLYMTSLTIFGYGFTSSGELITIDDDPLILQAFDLKALPIMLISSIDESGNFSNERAEVVFKDAGLRDTLITNIIDTMYVKGYTGLDIDFEFIADKESYIAFIEETTYRLHEAGFTVNVDLAPKVSSDQKGLLYEAHDYKRIGEIADTVLLMTYEWGYSLGPPMAIAPLNQVRRVVEYAVTQIEPSKIMLGIPNYAYDWRLPFVRGVTKAEVIGNQDAVERAIKYRAQIQFDEEAESPFYYYTDEAGSAHVVWFEDVRSILAKLRLIDEYSLLGGGYWNIMKKFAANWTVIDETYIVEK